MVVVVVVKGGRELTHAARLCVGMAVALCLPRSTCDALVKGLVDLVPTAEKELSSLARERAVK